MDHAIPLGITGAAAAAGLKPSGKADLGLLLSDRPCAWAALQTRNRFEGANLVLNRERLESGGPLRAIVVHAGQANACTGAEGLAVARATAEAAAAACGVDAASVLVGSTGVIGVLPDIGKLRAGLAAIKVSGLSEAGVLEVGKAMMTTDLVPKSAARELVLGGRAIRILGMTKGSGMIHPSMATMLAWTMTDAPVAQEDLRRVWPRVVDRSFHALTVDGDTSTSDIAAVLANGAAGGGALAGADLDAFESALAEACADLARQIARDGEGATRLLVVRTSEAASEADARRVSMAIARSSLVKTAIFGRDPNWGRIAAAVGVADARYEPADVTIRIGGTVVFASGRPAPFDRPAVQEYLRGGDEVLVEVSLGAGGREGTVWSCDLTDGYIRINADYTT